jgi:hypothetical protein
VHALVGLAHDRPRDADVQDPDPAGRGEGGQPGVQFVQGGDPLGLGAQGPGDGDHVGGTVEGARGRIQARDGELVELRSVGRVVQHDHQQVGSEPDGGLELLRVHPEAAVPFDRDRRTVRPDGCSYGQREALADQAEAIAELEGAAGPGRQVGGGEVPEVAHAGHDVRAVADGGVDRGDHGPRVQPVGGLSGLQRGAPGGLAGQQFRGLRTAQAGLAAGRKPHGEFGDRGGGVGGDLGDVTRRVPHLGRWAEVDPDQPGVAEEGASEGVVLIERRADDQDDVGRAGQAAGGRVRHRPGQAEVKGIPRVRQAALGRDGGQEAGPDPPADLDGGRDRSAQFGPAAQ